MEITCSKFMLVNGNVAHNTTAKVTVSWNLSAALMVLVLSFTFLYVIYFKVSEERRGRRHRSSFVCCYSLVLF